MRSQCRPFNNSVILLHQLELSDEAEGQPHIDHIVVIQPQGYQHVVRLSLSRSSHSWPTRQSCQKEILDAKDTWANPPELPCVSPGHGNHPPKGHLSSSGSVLGGILIQL